MTVEHPRKYLDIVTYCESFLDRHGDNYLGVGWTKRQEDADTRYAVMLDVITRSTAATSLLDFGCGASHLLEYILGHGLTHIEYSGLDLSAKFLELSRRKFPRTPYYQIDILQDAASLPTFDYVVLNGVFTSRCSMSFDEMFAYFSRVIRGVFDKARVGIAFNVMSKHVDWERDDLFHLPVDLLGAFLTREISRHFVVRHDYGLYEYAAYVYRHPNTASRPRTA
jgi:SAM-dependent methyltransferase